MRIEKIKISYSTTIPIMSYGVNDKISVDLEMSPATWTNIESGETTNESFNLEQLVSEHKANVDAIVRKLYPQYHQQVDSQFAISEPERGITISNEPVKFEGNVTLEQIIPKCKTLQELSMYEKIIDRKPESEEKRKLWLTYDEVYAKLSNQ